MNNHDLPVAIKGGGPVGLAAAAHLKKSNQPFILFETVSHGSVGPILSVYQTIRTG